MVAIEIATTPLLMTVIAVTTVFAIRDCAKESDSVLLQAIAVLAASLVGAFAIKLSNCKDGSSSRTSRSSAGS